MMEQLLTYAEVAEVLRVTPRTVYSLVRKGLLRAVRFGQSVRVDVEDLRDFIQRAKAVRDGR
jgi:excisionase family DNA binding protein